MKINIKDTLKQQKKYLIQCDIIIETVLICNWVRISQKYDKNKEIKRKFKFFDSHIITYNYIL